MRLRIVALTGAGVSAESGVRTFRDAGGLWEGHRVEDVATPEAWERDPETVLRFYNERRRQVASVQPNAAHRALAELEERHDVAIVTQNVDDLHERAGSSFVLHLHGELAKARSTKNPELVYHLQGRDIELGDGCDDGSQPRPHIVWFGEAVPLYDEARGIVESADVLLVIGTSLLVYPAAGLVDEASPDAEVYYVDPHPAPLRRSRLTVVAEPATSGVPKVIQALEKRRPGTMD